MSPRTSSLRYPPDEPQRFEISQVEFRTNESGEITASFQHPLPRFNEPNILEGPASQIGDGTYVISVGPYNYFARSNGMLLPARSDNSLDKRAAEFRKDRKLRSVVGGISGLILLTLTTASTAPGQKCLAEVSKNVRVATNQLINQ